MICTGVGTPNRRMDRRRSSGRSCGVVQASFSAPCSAADATIIAVRRCRRPKSKKTRTTPKPQPRAIQTAGCSRLMLVNSLVNSVMLIVRPFKSYRHTFLCRNCWTNSSYWQAKQPEFLDLSENSSRDIVATKKGSWTSTSLSRRLAQLGCSTTVVAGGLNRTSACGGGTRGRTDLVNHFLRRHFTPVLSALGLQGNVPLQQYLAGAR